MDPSDRQTNLKLKREVLRLAMRISSSAASPCSTVAEFTAGVHAGLKRGEKMNQPRSCRGRGPPAVLLLLRSGLLRGRGCWLTARDRGADQCSKSAS